MQPRYSIKAICLLGICLIALRLHPLRRIHDFTHMLHPTAPAQNLLTWHR